MTAAELREESAKVLAPAREVGCVESEFWLEVVCSSDGAVLKLFWWWHCVMLLVDDRWLQVLCDEHAPSNKNIHLIKIHFQRLRIWVLLRQDVL